MKKSMLVIAALALVAGAGAQRLVIGEKAPDVRVSEWLWGKPADESKATLIEFFHTGNQQCRGRIGNIEAIAGRYAGNLNVILLAKEPPATVRGAISGNGGTYFAAIDESGRTFEAFGVKFVPFSVLIDGRGKVVWSGNPESLSVDEIGRLIR